MKAIKKNLIVALMFGTLIGYANRTTNNNVVEKKTVKVEFKSVRKGQTLTIKNERGVTVYKHEVENSGTFSKLFDLSGLENGMYKAELNKDFEIEIKNFKVENGLVTFFDTKSKKEFKPVIRKEGSLLYVSKLDFYENKLNVVIYYDDEIILSETLKSENILKRIYKLSEDKQGDYTVVISSNNRLFTKNFTI